MCVVALTKIVVTWHYATQWKPALGLDWTLFVGQLRYALPFAIANALFLLRIQADQWVVASLYSPEDFAIFSIAAVVIPMSNLVRQPINNSLLPRIAESLNKEDLAAAQEVISRGYRVTGAVLLPFLGLLYVSADELVELIYTEKYRGAAPIMQVYLIGQLAAVFASGHLLPVFRCGRISAAITGVCLVATVVIGVAGAMTLGLVGAAVGSTLTLFLGEAWALFVVSRRLGTTVSRLLGVAAFVRALLAVGVAVLACWAISQYLLLDLALLVRIVLQSIAFVILWLVAIRLFGVDDVFRRMIHRTSLRAL
jgi:O-antigen/teichoic acid export membrane protein